MIKRTIEISHEPVHVYTELDQLRLRRQEPAEGLLGSVPCEDIGMLVVDQQQTTFSLGALNRLMEHGAAVIVCGRNHLPSGLLLPLASHTEVVWRLQAQIDVSKPTCKQLWRQLVVAKILAQAGNLPSADPVRRRLQGLAKTVKSGDPSNVEAQAAKIYWSAWLGAAGPFHREPDGQDALNAMLNYGYAVVRASVGRALVAAGLVPALGLHHANRSNAFCLADDLLEPLRPLVDHTVRRLHQQGQAELNRAAKQALLGVLVTTVQVADHSGPLLVNLHRYVASLIDCYEGRQTQLLIPRWREDER